MARPIEPRPQQGRRLRPFSFTTREVRSEAQETVGVAWAALGEIAPQALTRLARHGREPRQLGIGLVVAREECQRDAARAAGLDEALYAIGPIGAAAEQPGDDQPRPRNSVHIEIDRKVMAEPHDPREPQARGP